MNPWVTSGSRRFNSVIPSCAGTQASFPLPAPPGLLPSVFGGGQHRGLSPSQLNLFPSNHFIFVDATVSGVVFSVSFVGR